jgi:hypothetical protein
MEKLYLDTTNNHLATKKLSLEDLYGYTESLFKEDQTVCIYENVFSKNASVCFKTHFDFTTYWDTVEAKKNALLDNVKAFKAKPKEVKAEE